ncbi:uncharacterized protein [Nicotiana tomentosiformis]|uniref:uncharacterized protein isoform X3 n=1 Tax=Nicotiana tomentosiformis TaxID=4098 RepID=UPI00388CABF5
MYEEYWRFRRKNFWRYLETKIAEAFAAAEIHKACFLQIQGAYMSSSLAFAEVWSMRRLRFLITQWTITNNHYHLFHLFIQIWLT